MSRYHPQESFFRRIMLVPKTRVPLPMHPFGLRWERIKKPPIATKPLAYFLCLDLVAVPWRRLPCCIREPVAMPTPPWLISKRMELFDGAATVTDKIKSLSAEAPRDLNRLEGLIGKRDRPTAPMARRNTYSKGFIAPFPPVRCRLADISSAPERPNLDYFGLFYCPTPVAAAPAHDRNPLEIFIGEKLYGVAFNAGCASLTMTEVAAELRRLIQSLV
jgi:hypothetical protein